MTRVDEFDAFYSSTQRVTLVTTYAKCGDRDIARDATIEAYLENDGNVAATAKRLFTHRHTIRYRLERAKELCGHDVSSTEGREKLGLGLKAMRVLGISSPGGPAKEPGARSGRSKRGE